MIERKFHGGPIDVHCDSCPNGLETGHRDFAAARVSMREEGWKTRPFEGEWLHFCPDCPVPSDCTDLVRAGRGRR